MSVLNYDPSRNTKVTVVCITYGHEEYIRQALDSFLMQKTTFPYQIFVGEDKGPDKTADIVREYAQKYPDKIVAFLREENMGAQRNLIDMCQKANSPYIAFCEGDDFWIDEYKLQKQFDLMESHPEYRACVHATEILAEDTWYLRDEYNADEDGRIILPYSKPGFNSKLTELTAEEYIKTTPAHTSSYFYRWNYALEIPEWYYTHFAGDHSLMMLQTGKGLIGIIPDVMSVYRRSEVGVYYYADRTTHYFNVGYSWTKLLMDIRDYFDAHYDGYCYQVITNRIENGAVLYFKMMNELEKYDDFIKHFHEDRDVAVKMLDIVIKRASMYKELSAFKRKALSTGRNVKALKDRRRENRLRDYVRYEKVKKENNLWLFSCKNGFVGDARYLYEYVVAVYPEIRAVWLAENKNDEDFFVAQNLPFVRKATPQSRHLLKRASLLITDSMENNVFKMRGFNAGTKVVRLYDHDFFTLTQNDVSSVLVNKELSSNSEYYTDAFMVIAPSMKAVEYLSQKYALPENRFFVSAPPRIEAVSDYLPEGKKILYVPDDFSNAVLELAETELLESLEQINQIAEINHFEFYHWCKSRSDKTRKLKNAMNNFEHIHFLSQDIYSLLPHFDVLISGLSNVMFDYLPIDKPIIIYEKNLAFFKSAKNYTFDMREILPGMGSCTLSEALDLAVSSLNDKKQGADLRSTVLSKLYDYDITKENNSERIISEIIRRLEQNRENNL